MGVNRCLHQALLIARQPRAEWRTQIDQIAEACQAPGVCTGGIGCRQRIAEYLRVQWWMIERRKSQAARRR
ncbi:hypothetical protein JAK64_05955 [Stenotrophomonas maltophilia]|nr:hypothetical protein [Stenotrophomonas maltophilia]